MVQHDEDTAARNRFRIVGVGALGQGRDLGLQRVETRADLLRQAVFRHAVMLDRQRLQLGLHAIEPGLLLRGQLLRVGVDPAHAVRVRVVDAGLGPPPALGRLQLAGECCQLIVGQPVEQSGILEPAAAILGEQVAGDRATGIGVGFGPDEHRPAVAGRHLRLGQQAADGVGFLVPGQAGEGLLLAGVVLGQRERGQLVERQPALAVDLQQPGADRTQAQPLPHQLRRHPKPGGDLLGRGAMLVRQAPERLELVGGMQALPHHVLGQARLLLVTGGDDAGHGHVLGHGLALGQQLQGGEPATATGDPVLAGFGTVRVELGPHGQALQQAVRLDAGGQLLHAVLAAGAADVGGGQDQLVQGDFQDAGGHHMSPCGVGRSAALQPCPSARPG